MIFLILFHRPTVDAKRHEIFEILSVKDNAVLVQGQDGNQTEVTQKQAKSFGVFAARDIQIAPGDRIMLQQNRRSPDLRATNGEIAEVKQIDAEGHASWRTTINVSRTVTPKRPTRRRAKPWRM
jgi:hypothetical protein